MNRRLWTVDGVALGCGVRVAAMVALPLLLAEAGRAQPIAVTAAQVSASSSAEGAAIAGAVDGDRYSTANRSLWRGDARDASWQWQVDLGQPQALGAILQINGDDELVLRNAPRDYVWQGTVDGQVWFDLPQTRVRDERRSFRVHRLDQAVVCRAVRIAIDAARDGSPALREVEFFCDPAADIEFPQWILTVNTETTVQLPFQCPLFVALARECPEGRGLLAQAIAVDEFEELFLAIEPTPLCAFMTGNLVDWCQHPRAAWRGVQQILEQGRLPLWASCGGAQGLAIVSDAGVDRPWDCPHCRNPDRPLLPVYTHIGHTAERPCGDYSGCIFERGPHWVRQALRDPVFAGLEEEFQVMESHCGQIAYAPAGWRLVTTAGRDAQTKTQCLRRADRYIYAAQFHIELSGTPETSRIVMNNFLKLSKQWGGYQAGGSPVALPE